VPKATRPDVLVKLLDRVWPHHPVEKMGQEHMVQCPFCATTKNKLAVNPSKGVFQCWVCGEKGPVMKLLGHLKKLKVIAASDVRAVASGGVLSRLSTAVSSYTKEIKGEKTYWSEVTPCVVPPHTRSIFNSHPKNELEGRCKKSVIGYLCSRRLDLNDIKRYRLGYCFDIGSIYNGHVFIPALGPHGRQMVFWTTRASNEVSKPKSLHAGKKYSRFSAKQIMMNEHLITGDEVALCEGPFDAFSIMSVTGVPAVPLLGKVLHPYHLERLREKGIKKVYVCLDPDAKGVASMLWGRLAAGDYDVRLVELEDGDPNDVSPEALKAAFDKATSKLTDPLTYFCNRLT